MKPQIDQYVFSNLMTKLNIQQPKSEKEIFDTWMRTKVKSIHYANNQAMLNAYNRIDER